MTNPRVTVAVPTYNGGPYIGRAIESVLSQTFRDFELLVIDDGSTDNSCEVIEGIPDNRIRLLRNDGNRGLAWTRNRLVDEARGEYLAWLDQDDACLPKRLERQLSLLNGDRRVVICGAAARVFFEGGRPVSQVMRASVSGGVLAASQMFWNSLSTSTVAMRLKPLREAGLRFDADLVPTEDYMFWLKAAACGRLVVDPSILVERWELLSGASHQMSERQLRGARRVRLEAVRLVVPAVTPDQASIHRKLTEGLHGAWTPAEIGEAVKWLEVVSTKSPDDCRYTVRDAKLVAGATLLRLVRHVCRTSPGLAARTLMGSALRWHALRWTSRRLTRTL
jgi:hypothetical protein